MDHVELVGCYMATAGLLVAANHEVETLRAVIEKADALAHVAGMFPVPVEGTALYTAYKEYMEARHG